MSVLRRGPAPGAVAVVVTDERPEGDRPADEPVDLARWQHLAEAVLAGEGVVGMAELTVAFVDEEAMADLNVTHMNGTGPTDVLSFPLDAEPDPTAGAGAPRLLGDVVICPSVARRNAVPPAGYDGEIALLVVHGVLHVLGMDHADEDEAAEMLARERHHLAAIGVERRP